MLTEWMPATNWAKSKKQWLLVEIVNYDLLNGKICIFQYEKDFRHCIANDQARWMPMNFIYFSVDFVNIVK